MRDLVLKSHRHQRYEQSAPVMGNQFCRRTLIVKNVDFRQLMNVDSVSPTEGFVVRLINEDVRDEHGNYMDMMQPKFMSIASDTIDKIELKGVAFSLMGVNTMDFSDYAITLHLVNRKVVKFVLHLLDRGVDIEYLDMHP